MMLQRFLREFCLFGIKQASACVFGGALLAMILLTAWWYPLTALHRYDFLLLFAVGFQVFLLAARLETWRESLVIVIFHVVATLMELFKTSPAIRSWHYPEEFDVGIAGVPLFAGFMYSAVGSYIARVWRLFDFQFTRYPPRWASVVFVVCIYANFFTHHFVTDVRWPLVLVSVLLFGRTWIYFRPADKHRGWPLLLGWLMVASFIWFAENIATFARIWIYPSQQDGWHPVSLDKLVAWYLLMMLSFVLVSLVNEFRTWQGRAVNDPRGADAGDIE